MAKWIIDPKVIYSPSSGETVSTAWQKQIKISQHLQDCINRVRVMDASAGSNISDPEAFQFKVNTTDKTLLIRNASNTGWIVCGYLDKDYFGITPETIYGVKNNGGVNSIEVVTEQPLTGGSNGNIAIDTTNKKLYQRINGVWTLLLSLSATDLLDYSTLIKNNGGDIGQISIVNSAPSGGNNGDIAVDITNKRMYQKNNDTWNLIFSLRASDLSDYDNLITQEDISTTAEANKIPRADGTGKLPNNIAGSPDKIAGKKIIPDAMADGTTPVYRSSADGGSGGFVFEGVSPGSVINDNDSSLSTTYSSEKINDFVDNLNNSINDITTTVTEVLNQKLPEIQNKILQETVYAVGKPFISFTDNRNPAEILGFGTWEKIGAGRCLVSEGDGYNIGTTGGEATHTLSWNEMPVHNHSAWTDAQGNHSHSVNLYNVVSNAGNSGGAGSLQTNYSTHAAGNTNATGAHGHTVGIGNTGGGQAHNNMPPYLVAYIWKRIE